MTLPKPKARAPTCWHGQQQLQRNNNTTTTQQQHINSTITTKTTKSTGSCACYCYCLSFACVLFCFVFSLPCAHTYIAIIYVRVFACSQSAPCRAKLIEPLCVCQCVCVCVLQLVVCTWPQTFLQHVGNTVRNNLHTLAMDTHICIQMIMIKLQFDGKCLNTL